MTHNTFTVIGADWCGFTKKLVNELKEHNIDHDYIECSDKNNLHPACKQVDGYPHVTPCGKEHAEEHAKAKKGVPGYRTVAEHPVINGEITCDKGGGGGKAHGGGGGGHPFTLIGAGWCGFTVKMREELDIDNVDHNVHVLDCADGDKDDPMCKHANIKGFPTMVCGHGNDALKNLDAGNHVAGYKAAADHEVVNGLKCSL